MNAELLHTFRRRLDEDTENREFRRDFYEFFSWLEIYSEKNFGSRLWNAMLRFQNEHHEFYWNNPAFKEAVRPLCLLFPVGSNQLNFDPRPNVDQAATFLLFESDLYETENEEVGDVEHEPSGWTQSGFHAVMVNLKQIRDNLFHGNKMSLDEEHYNRDKDLVRLGSQCLLVILNLLNEAENRPRN